MIRTRGGKTLISLTKNNSSRILTTRSSELLRNSSKNSKKIEEMNLITIAGDEIIKTVT